MPPSLVDPMETTLIDPRATILALERRFQDALRAGDVAGLVDGFYADDAQFHAPNAPPAVGKTTVHGAIQSLVDGGLQSLSLETIDVGGRGDTLWNRGRYTLRMQTPDGPVEDVGTYVTIFEKQDDGAFRCVVDIFNSDQAA